MNKVVITLVQSLFTGVPSEKVSSSGTTDQPSLTPVNPAGLLKEFISIAHLRAPSISKMLLGNEESRINSLYAASKTIIQPLPSAKSTSVLSSCFVETAPVGLLGEQKYIREFGEICERSGKKLFSGVHGI